MQFSLCYDMSINRGTDMAAVKRMLEELADGEVTGVDADGGLILWDREGEVEYNCGETLEEYGVENLTDRERQRLTLPK
jgi:hypothetical protein